MPGRRMQIRISDDERDLVRFYDERQTDPMRRGDLTHDVKYCIRFTMAYLKKNDVTGFDFLRLSDMNPDKMSDQELVWFMEQSEKASRHLKNNMNANSRYFKYKQRRNL